MNGPDRLRVGLLIDDFTVPAWVARIAREIQASDFATLALIVRNAAAHPPARLGWRQRWRERWQCGLYQRYKEWDRARPRADGQPDAFAPCALGDLIESVPTLAVVPQQKRFSDRLSPQDCARVEDARLDVLFRFGFRILRGGILRAARCGVWSFHHGDNREYRGSAAGFWELYEKNPVIGSILQVLTEDLDGGRVLYRSWSATDLGSQYATLNPMYWKTAGFALRRLRDLHTHGQEWLQNLPEYRERTPYRKPLYHVPAAPAMARFLARQGAQKLGARARELAAPRRRHWYIAVRPRAHTPVWQDTHGFARIAAPAGRFYADPHLFEDAGRTWLFFEDYDYARMRARISCLELAGEGVRGEPVVVLERPYHLSYPFVFCSRREFFMIPESRENHTIELYRARRFPWEWKLEAVLMDKIEAVDATVCERDGRFWMFANIAAPGASSHDELHLFHAPAPAGPWIAHPRNPIISDVRQARPAGALFQHAGGWVRPSQDCGVRYGSAIQFQQITVWTEANYEERPLARLQAGWCPGNIGTHTYNRSSRFEVLDGLEMQRLRFGRIPGCLDALPSDRAADADQDEPSNR